MAIPASHIVEIAPRVVAGGSNDLVFNGLLLSENPTISATSLVSSFPSATAVGEFFGTDSDEYRAAEVYFTSYDNKFSAPEALLVARRVSEDASAWVRGGKISATLSQFKAIYDGSMRVTINNTEVSVDNLSFATATSLSHVAEILQDAISSSMASMLNVTVTYSSLTGAFTITSGTSGENSTISFAYYEQSDPNLPASTGTDMAAMFKLREEDGAVLSLGMNAMTIEQQMNAVKNATQNFVSFTTVSELEADEMLQYASWANENYGWLYVAYTTNASTPVAESASDPASILKDSGFDHTTIIYGSLEYAAFIMGTVASVPWGRTNGTITFAFKSQSGLAAWAVNESAATVLESKNCNYFGDFATRNASFVFMYPGCLSASDYGFIDPYINSVWLNNRLQVAMMDGLKSSGRTPYNDRGYTMVRAWMMDPVNEARNNAAIEAGVELSERQKSEIFNEAGLDISKELWTQGYYIQILDPGASVRARRGSPVISLWYTYAGAIQRIEVASTAVL